MKNQIVLISGKQGSGKSTLVRALEEYFPKAHVNEFRFATTIYRIHDFARMKLEDLGLPVPEDLKIKDGKLLQFLGTEWGRQSYGEDVWVRACQGEVTNYFDLETIKPKMAIVSDCRFKNEFDAFPESLRVRLECPKMIRKDRCENWRENDTHPSEVDLDDHVFAGHFDMIFDTQFDKPKHIATLIAAQLSKNVWIEKRAEL